MKKNLPLAALIVTVITTPAMASEYIIKEISDPTGEKPYYFEPDHLTIQPGDTVTFMDAQDDGHNVMFVSVPKMAEDMIMSPMMESEGEKWSYTFTAPGTYNFHCHPHEAAGMKGTLIVGQESSPDETKILDHMKMGAHTDDSKHMHTHSHTPLALETKHE